MDIIDFSKDIIVEDDLGSFVRGHIHIEHALIDYLKATHPFPKFLEKANLSYSAICTFALCSGLDPDLEAPLKSFGKLRNRFSHKLGISITKTEANNLFNTISPKLRKPMYAAYQSTHAKQGVTAFKGFKSLPPKDQVVLMLVSVRATIYGCLHLQST